MSSHHHLTGGIRQVTTGLVATVALVASGLTAGPAAASDEQVVTPATSRAIPTDLSAGRYVITFAGEPAATYQGGKAGLPRTAPAHGSRLSAADSVVRRYVSHLQRAKRTVLKDAGVTQYTDYSLVLNGAAADLTKDQALKLAHHPGVVAMAKDRLLKVQTNRSPDFIGVPGLWRTLGGRDRAGSGVVVGVLDTGVWPESASFAPNGTPVPASFTGACQTGQEFGPEDCNGKIVGARYYLDGFGADKIAESEFVSPRDSDGHGSHTASTAVGNRVDDVQVEDARFGTLSGMAPGAKLAAYKVCWTGKVGVSADGCKSSDIVAAVNDAVKDGVDVINFSIGGSSESPVNDPQEVAFLNAAAAGVFVATSAGNNGPGASTIDHPAPWTTTVAASTHKVSEAVLELADGRRIVGASSTPPLPELTPMVLSTDAAGTGVEASDARLCLPDSLDPAKVAGKLVVCVRGVNDRAEKSLVVKQAGGAGMVLVNPSVNTLNADLHHVPTIHVQSTALTALTQYVQGGQAQGRIVALREGESDTKAPEIAEFSSRGPSTTTAGNILKPDVAAPGVDVLAAVSPVSAHGRNYDMQSGTSMAAPHVAGLAALLLQAHPGWTPMMVKSALMTTARDMANASSPFAQGAGNVRPTLATDPGVVFASGMRDWIGYLKGERILRAGAYPAIPPLQASDLNQASIAVGAVAGAATVTRTLTSVSQKTEHYRFHAAVPGFTVTATPSQFTLKPSESRTVSIRMVRTTAPIDQWASGSVIFSSSAGQDRFNGDATPKNGHIAQLPVALRPVLVAVEPQHVTGTGTTGQAAVRIQPGRTGSLTTAVHGLTGTTPENDTIAEGTFDPAAPAAGPATKVRTVEVPAGTGMVRFDTVMTGTGNDIDMYVYRTVGGAEKLVALSGTTTGNEEVVMHDPTPGTYKVYVNGYAVEGDGAYVYRGWVVPDVAAGNLTVTPATSTVRQGTEVDLTLRWTGLDTAQDWFGSVEYSIDGTEGSRTTVLVD